MKVTPVVTPKAVRERLLELIHECDSFSWASAWVTENDAFRAAVAARAKMTRFVIGTHRYVTSSDCLEACLRIPQAKVVAPDGPMFHPKVYAFHLDDCDVVYVGSSNLTQAGLAHNVECGVFLSGVPDHPNLKRFFDFIERQWIAAEELDDVFLAAYRANQERVKDVQDALKQFIRIKKPRRTAKSAHDVDPTKMTWPHFVRLVRKDKTHGLEPRLRVLSRARQLFAQGVPFARLSETDRKCLAGILKPSIRDGLDWGYFGQMSAFGSYTPILNLHANAFSKALDYIPLLGTVERKHFDAYLATIMTIPEASPSWIGMGTRLLTMKRPDRFVCIDSANRDGLCAYFGVAPTTTNLDNYWDRIIAPMMLMPWWQTEISEHAQEQEIWMGRAALLDAIYYDPNKRRE